jgi:hypothetical protein
VLECVPRDVDDRLIALAARLLELLRAADHDHYINGAGVEPMYKTSRPSIAPVSGSADCSIEVDAVVGVDGVSVVEVVVACCAVVSGAAGSVVI